MELTRLSWTKEDDGVKHGACALVEMCSPLPPHPNPSFNEEPGSGCDVSFPVTPVLTPPRALLIWRSDLCPKLSPWLSEAQLQAQSNKTGILSQE